MPADEPLHSIFLLWLFILLLVPFVSYRTMRQIMPDTFPIVGLHRLLRAYILCLCAIAALALYVGYDQVLLDSTRQGPPTPGEVLAKGAVYFVIFSCFSIPLVGLAYLPFCLLLIRYRWHTAAVIAALAAVLAAALALPGGGNVSQFVEVWLVLFIAIVAITMSFSLGLGLSWSRPKPQAEAG